MFQYAVRASSSNAASFSMKIHRPLLHLPGPLLMAYTPAHLVRLFIKNYQAPIFHPCCRIAPRHRLVSFRYPHIQNLLCLFTLRVLPSPLTLSSLRRHQHHFYRVRDSNPSQRQSSILSPMHRLRAASLEIRMAFSVRTLRYSGPLPNLALTGLSAKQSHLISFQ